ncbi:MAG: hypothetical protein ACYC77_08750 [Coriobacteriia bacterium]
MYGLSIQAIAQQVVEVWKALAVATWDVVAAEPRLQLMLVGFVALTLMGGGARGRARRAR